MKDERKDRRSCHVKSIPRDHSPYCEATGPIVKEGFVAARVRGFQALEHDTDRKKSHSPMIPCPVPHWLTIYEPQVPPIAVCTLNKHTKEISQPTHPPSRCRPSECETESCQRSRISRCQVRSAVTEEGSQRRTIYGPRAIPPNLASLGESETSRGDKDSQKIISPHLQRSIRPRRSIAEKLGSLVEKNFEESRFLDEVFDEQWLLQPLSPMPESQPKAESSKGSKISNSRAVNDQQSADKHDLEMPRPVLSSNRNGMGSEGQSNLTAYNLDTHDHSTHLQDSPSPDLSSQHDTRRSRAQTLQASTPIRKRDIRAQLRALSLSQLIDRQLSDWENLGTEETLKANSKQPVIPGKEISMAPPSPTQSVRTESPPSSVGTARSIKSVASSKHSLSWLARLPRYRLALVDKTSTSKQVSGRSSMTSLNDKASQNTSTLSNRGHPPSPRDMEYTKGVDGLEDSKRNTTSEAEIAGFTEEQQRLRSSQMMRDRRIARQDQTVPTSIPVDEDTVGAREEVPFASIDLSRPETPIQIPAKTDGQTYLSAAFYGAKETSPPSKEESQSWARESRSEDNKLHSTSLENLSTAEAARGDSTTPSTAKLAPSPESTTVRSPPKRMSMNQLKPSSYNVSQSQRRTDGGVFRTESERKEDGSTETIHFETTGKAKAIRRVQVIVSLDGSDEVCVQATLLKRSRRRTITSRK